jgi:hypothetical protein
MMLPTTESAMNVEAHERTASAMLITFFFLAKPA